MAKDWRAPYMNNSLWIIGHAGLTSEMPGQWRRQNPIVWLIMTETCREYINFNEYSTSSLNRHSKLYGTARLWLGRRSPRRLDHVTTVDSSFGDDVEDIVVHQLQLCTTWSIFRHGVSQTLFRRNKQDFSDHVPLLAFVQHAQIDQQKLPRCGVDSAQVKLTRWIGVKRDGNVPV